MTAVLAEPVADPSFVNIPPRDGSLLRAVEGVAQRIGRSLDPAQRTAIDVLTSSWADGRPAALESVLIAPRQNLKTYCFELIALTRLLRPGGDRLVVWSAHEVSTAQETFKAFCDLADTNRWFSMQIKGISRSTGREFIRFKGGQRLKFKARVNTGGRGLAGDCVFLDEAFALKPEHMGSLLPILSTRARGQILYGSSAPHATSTILHSAMKRGRAGGEMAPAYLEWSAPGSLRDPRCALEGCAHEPGTPGCTLDDEALWLRVNTAAAYGRITLSYLRAERRALPVEEFARERLGWGESPEGAAETIPISDWLALVDEASKVRPDTRPVFALDVRRDQRAAAIAVAGRRSDDLAHVGLIRHRPGVAWVLAEMKALRERHRVRTVILDGASPAFALVPDLTAAGFEVEVTSARDMAAACGGLQAAVNASTLRHRGDPIVTSALQAAARRPIGDDGWGWGRKASDGDICPIVAVTLAHYALTRARRPYDLSKSFG